MHPCHMGRLGIPPPSHLCTGSMEFLRYCGLVVRTAFSHSLDYAQAVVFALVIAAGLLTYLTFDGSVDARAWQLVAAVVGVGIAFRLALATYGSGKLTVTHIFLLWAKDLISLADPAALGGRARERTCSMKPVIGPRPSSGRPTLGMPDAPTVS